MKILGIIAEYNPFHNGHLYHIQKSKEITNSDYVIVIMSGDFTQQGNIAIFDKFKRAKLATKNGADLVIELPTIYANSSSQYFAKGAISLLNSLNIVDYISFGSESSNIDTLLNISKIILNNEKEIWEDISNNLKSGISFAQAREQSIAKYLSVNEISKLSKPNNILGIDYLTNLLKLSSNIKPYTIKRNSSEFNDKNINETGNFASATSIRELLYNNGNMALLKNIVPIETLDMINSTPTIFNDKLFDILKYKIITSKKEKLANINEVTEGLENRIIDSISTSSSYNELLNNIKCKRYQMSKIKRMLNNIILDISKLDFENISNSNQMYAHVLSTSKRGKILLSEISKKSNIPLITSINENVLNNLSDIQRKMLEKDILSSNIYSILTNEPINKDYTNRL